MIVFFIILFFVSCLIRFYLKKKLIFRKQFTAVNYIYCLFPVFTAYLLFISGYNYFIISIVTAIVLILTIVIYCDNKFVFFKSFMFFCIVLSCLAVLCIVLCLFGESLVFFSKISVIDFLFGTKWKPDSTVIDGKYVGNFGILPLLVGTLLIMIFAMAVAIPLGLFSAIYLCIYSNKRVSYVINTILEILAGVPTVVYGYFAVIFLSPAIRRWAEFFNFSVQSENALVAGLVIGVMILPFITSLMENAIASVPKTLRYASMALGATQLETVWHILIPYAFPSIVSAIILSISRVIGETLIVLMAAGINANLTFNPLHSITTITVQIASLLTGDQDFSSVQTSSAYALGLVLFIITWLLNLFAMYVMKRSNRYR